MEFRPFQCIQLTDHIYRIIDPIDVACHLIKGEKEACLIDTCTGAGHLKEYVDSITDLPLTVIVSHAHMDHCGGAGPFGKVYMKESEKPILKVHRSQTFRAEFFHDHVGGDFVPEDFLPVPEEVFYDFPDDWILDLGGVTVEMLPFPGHTPGMICPFIPEDRTLIIGDACDDNVLLFDEYASSISEYLWNLKSLIERKDDYDRLLGNHGHFEYPMDLLENVKDSCERILSHTDAHLFVHVMGHHLYTANPIGEDDLRLDGKAGNVLYSEEKVC